MNNLKKIIVLLIAVVFISLSAWLIYSRTEARRAQARRDATYQSQLEQFQRDLRLGMPRSEVKSYLDARKITYSEMNWNYDVKIGEDPSDSIFCEKWDIYIDMRFNRLPKQVGSSPFDNLDAILF